MKNSLCKKLWACRNTEYEMTEFNNDCSGASVYKAEWLDECKQMDWNTVTTVVGHFKATTQIFLGVLKQT